MGSALAATALAAALSFTAVDAAKADVAGLTPCSESKAFAKREKNEVKTLTKRLKQVSDAKTSKWGMSGFRNILSAGPLSGTGKRTLATNPE